jgi:hypothetical protein
MLYTHYTTNVDQYVTVGYTHAITHDNQYNKYSALSAMYQSHHVTCSAVVMYALHKITSY